MIYRNDVVFWSWFSKAQHVTITICFLAITSLTSAQEFKLFKPDSATIWKNYQAPDFQNDLMYAYLETYYAKVGDMDSVQYYNESLNSICAFKQQFEHGIKYTYYSCHEHGGDVTLIIPRMNLIDLVQLIEFVVGDSFEHGWNMSLTKYEPIDQGIGCYVKIIDLGSRLKIDYYCGC